MPDVNILIYAHRQDVEDHAAYQSWLERAVDGPQPFALSVLVAIGFVRVVTHPKFPGTPTPLPQALAVIDGMVAHPNCRLVFPGERHWKLVAELCRATSAHGAEVADVQHAALAMEHGCTWVSRDADLAELAAHGLTWQRLALDA